MAIRTETLKKVLATFSELLLKSNKPLNALGIGTGAMLQGYIGKVTGFEFDEVIGARTVPRTNDQVMIIDGKSVVVAKKGEPAVAYYMVFEEGGKRITTTLLEQNANSTIDFGEGNVKKFSTFTGADWGNLTDKTLRCDYAARDTDAAPIARLTGEVKEGVAVLAPNAPMLYRFSVVAEVVEAVA